MKKKNEKILRYKTKKLRILIYSLEIFTMFD